MRKLGQTLFGVIGLIGLASSCNQTPSQKFVDTCMDVPASCSGVYSPDGQFLAFLSPADHHSALQVYRIRLHVPKATPELISIDSSGNISNGGCDDIAYDDDGELTFQCAGNNLVANGSGQIRYSKLADAPLAVSDL